MPWGVHEELDAVAFRVTKIDRPGRAMGNRIDRQIAIGLEGTMKASKALKITDTEGNMVERTGTEFAVFGLTENYLVMFTGIARQKHHLVVVR